MCQLPLPFSARENLHSVALNNFNGKTAASLYTFNHSRIILRCNRVQLSRMQHLLAHQRPVRIGSLYHCRTLTAVLRLFSSPLQHLCRRLTKHNEARRRKQSEARKEDAEASTSTTIGAPAHPVPDTQHASSNETMLAAAAAAAAAANCSMANVNLVPPAMHFLASTLQRAQQTALVNTFHQAHQNALASTLHQAQQSAMMQVGVTTQVASTSK